MADLNKELRSKYSIDLNAPAHEIVYCGAIRQKHADKPTVPNRSRPTVTPLPLHGLRSSVDQQSHRAAPSTDRATRGHYEPNVRLLSARASSQMSISSQETSTARPADFIGYARAAGDHFSRPKPMAERDGTETPVPGGSSFIDNIIANSGDPGSAEKAEHYHYLEQGYSTKTIEPQHRPSQGRTSSLPAPRYDIETQMSSKGMSPANARQDHSQIRLGVVQSVSGGHVGCDESRANLLDFAQARWVKF